MSTRAEALLQTLIALDPLADLPRTGWLLRGVRPCESIAEHSYGVALVTLLLVEALRAEGQAVDGEKALRLALLHDAPEAATGDLPLPRKSPALKAALAEQEAAFVAETLPAALAADWAEGEARQSLEARLVKVADRIHLLTKALIYARQGRGQLDEFWAREDSFGDEGLAVAREVFAALRAARAR